MTTIRAPAPALRDSPRTLVCRRLHLSAYHQGFSRLLARISTVRSGFRSVDCPLRLRVDDALACLHEDDKDWFDEWRTQLSCWASRHATLVTHLFPDQEPPPEFLKKSPRRSHGSALGSHQHSWRLTDKIQILSWNPGPARGCDQRGLADHLHGPWHIICIQEGAGFVNGSFIEEKILHRPPAPLHRAPQQEHFCAGLLARSVQVPRMHTCASWAVEGVVELPSRPCFSFHDRKHSYQ